MTDSTTDSYTNQQESKLQTLNHLLQQQAIDEGYNNSRIKGVGIFKASEPKSKSPNLYDPLICLVTQGEKVCHVGDATYNYKAGDFFINFLPMPVQTEIVNVSSKNPLLTAALEIDLVRLADMILQLERVENYEFPEVKESRTCALVGTADEQLIDVFTRLIASSCSASDAAIIGNNIVDEIYYRILTSEHGYALRLLLNQYGQIQPISKAINFIHANLDKTIQVTELASLSNMSKTTFFNAFKRLMHVPPNQYIKAIKLQKAQALLLKGMQANEASYHVGYNSFSQFSREYKRFYGFPPSETHVAV